jgi:hypothetical protein
VRRVSMKKLLVTLAFLLLFAGCLPKPPLFKTDHGTECGKKCLYLYTYGKDHSRQDLQECYKKCWEMEQGYYFFDK